MIRACACIVALICCASGQVAPSIEADGENMIIRTSGSGSVQIARGSTISDVATSEDLDAIREDTSRLNAMTATIESFKEKTEAVLQTQANNLDGLNSKMSMMEAATAEMKSMLATMEDTMGELRSALNDVASTAADTRQCQIGVVDAQGTAIDGCPTPDSAADGCKDYVNDDDLLTPLGHGTVSGAIRLLQCKDGYVLNSPSVSGTVVCHDGEWSDKGNSKCEATTSTTATTTTATSTTTTPSPWKLVYRQKKCGNDGTDQGSEGDDCYAKLSDIANYKVDGRFTFKMVYPGEWQNDVNAPEIQWSQTSNPMDTNDKVDNYNDISKEPERFWYSAEDSERSFNGLALSSQEGALLDGHHPSKNWFYVIGYGEQCLPSSPFYRWQQPFDQFFPQKGCERCERAWGGACHVELYIRIE